MSAFAAGAGGADAFDDVGDGAGGVVLGEGDGGDVDVLEADGAVA